MSEITQGRRVQELEDVKEPGDYCLLPSMHTEADGGGPRGFHELWFKLPGAPGGVRHIHDGPGGWSFVQEGDESITVSPSIFAHIAQSDGTTKPGWHGFLSRGVWREC